jgi:hypothetical protein
MPMLWPKPELPPQVPEQQGVLVGVQSKVE